MSDLSIRVDSASFGAAMRGLRDAERTLYLQTRRRIRAAAEPVVQDVKNEIMKGGPSKTGMRAGLAAGTKASISLGRKAGVTITTRGRLAKAYNRPSFRHPLFGDREHWYTEAGHPYFDTVILRHRFEFQKAILQAVQDSIRAAQRAA